MVNDISNYDNSMAEHRWQCKCPTGYLGASCEHSVCDNNPCQYGGTCKEILIKGGESLDGKNFKK